MGGIIILACTKLQDFAYLKWLIETSRGIKKAEAAVDIYGRHLAHADMSRSLKGFYRDIGVWIVAFLGTVLVGVLQGIALSCAVSLVVLLYSVVFPPVIQ